MIVHINEAVVIWTPDRLRGSSLKTMFSKILLGGGGGGGVPQTPLDACGCTYICLI